MSSQPESPGSWPRWFLLLPLLAIAAWWPLEPYWQSDDYLALHYAGDFGRVLHDFVGPQYGATDIWLFYRPLITLSFWFDQLVAGADPFFSHLSNVFAHGISTLLVALLWRRFLPDSAAFSAGLLWALMPGHVGSLAWAVGRVDSHTTVWCLLACWLFVRQCDRAAGGERAPRWPALAATALALMSKESAFVLPPVATVLAFCCSSGTPARRVRFAVGQTSRLWLLFAAYLGFRALVLGRLGGYLAASYDPIAMASGLGLYLRNLFVPLAWTGGDALAAITSARGLVLTLAALLLLPAAIYWLRRPARLGVAALLFLGAAAPLAAFLAGASNVHNLRYFYLPTVILAGLLAAPGRIATALVLLAWCLPWLAVRTEQRTADRESAAMHTAILREASDGAPSPMFVAGLPHSNRSGTAVQLHFAVDRMLQPPFADGQTQLYALRPLAEVPGVFRPWPAGEPYALPIGSTWLFADPTAFGRAAPPPPLPDLPIAGDDDGLVDVATSRLLEATDHYQRLFAERAPSFGITTPGVRPQVYRLTLFTANGYLCCLCQDHGLGPAGTGSIDMLRFLVHDPVSGTRAALIAAADDQLASAHLQVPITIDLVPEFPALLEAGVMNGMNFQPTHRARRLLRFRFDREYPAWVRLLQGG